jgi:hypothetical protein
MKPSRQFQIIARTPEQKADLAGSWALSDEDFFSAGACHILAGMFLRTYPNAGFQALLLQPAPGFRGTHVVVANPESVFDCRGWTARNEFLCGYAAACDALYPGWSYSLQVIGDPLSEDFCQSYRHRHPSRFFSDPLPRARAYLAGFPPPP